MPANRALFIDRDGTINVDCPYCWKIEDLRIYDDAVDIIRKYSSDGYIVVVITNQSGIGRGYFTKEDMERFNAEISRQMAARGARIDAFYYCPHTPSEKCECRKPGTEMIERSAEEFDIDLSKSLVIGDRDDIDGEMARKLGMQYRIINRK
ncbi:MAG: HAD family hydrolase [Candidatus Thermoplasmatota archaeon]|jgi:histidinol-phosphate phosphatase family protein|nr:HAD family hydrolase [Candidatus Thermoplasmatota archaeon]MCL5785710.1 HAD family hydrolase [Candidatus Thermoplasmatota archaeon]